MKTIKVKETRMHSYTFKENEGTNYYRVGGSTVPVAEAKLVLIECNQEEALIEFRGNYSHFPSPGNYKKFKPILISETEKIETGDSFYVSDLPHDPPSIFKATRIEAGHSGVHGKVWFSDNDYIVLALCKKVIALPEHFSPKLLQDIVDGKLKEGDKVLVECVSCDQDIDCLNTKSCRISEQCGCKPIPTYQVIKLNSSGHITLHKLEEKKYNREEVLSILKRFALYVDADKVESPSIYRHVVGEWFNTNVK